MCRLMVTRSWPVRKLLLAPSSVRQLPRVTVKPEEQAVMMRGSWSGPSLSVASLLVSRREGAIGARITGAAVLLAGIRPAIITNANGTRREQGHTHRLPQQSNLLSARHRRD